MKYLLLCFALCCSAGAYEGEVAHGKLVIWVQDRVNVYIDETVPVNLRLRVKRAAQNACLQWTRAVSYRRVFRLSATPRGANIVISYGSMDTQYTAYATLSSDVDGNILSAQIVLNTTVQEWWSQLWYDGLLLHEMGHAIGMGHSDQVVSVMNPYSWVYFRYPTTDDIQGVRWIYGLNAYSAPRGPWYANF